MAQCAALIAPYALARMTPNELSRNRIRNGKRTRPPNAPGLESLRPYRSASARRHARAGDATAKHDHRHPFPHRDPAGGGARQAASRPGGHSAHQLRGAGDQGAQCATGQRPPRADDQPRPAPCRSRRHGHRPAAGDVSATAVLLHGTAGYRRQGRPHHQ